MKGIKGMKSSKVKYKKLLNGNIIFIAKKSKQLVHNIINKGINVIYTFIPFRYGLESEKIRRYKIIISFTSYPKRFDTIPITLKSIVYQSFKPDKIILYLCKEECGGVIPDKLKKLEQYGLEIVLVDNNIKPHKKYFYSMQEYPNDIIVTIDDDIVYPRNFLKRLYYSHEKNPNCIMAARVHKILKNDEGKLEKYNNWRWEYKKCTVPSNSLFATGAGGVLYPPNALPVIAFDIKNIQKLCLEADDVWLKFMEIINDTKVVYVANANKHLWTVEGTSENGLAQENVLLNKNDIFINNVMEYYKISVEDITENTSC